MRRKPVTRSEIRFNGSHISTLPVDAVRKDEFGRIVPIRALWTPLLRSMNRDHARNEARRAQAQQELSGEHEMQRRAILAFMDFGPCNPVRLPDYYMWPIPRRQTCQHCSREFYRVSDSGRYCSDGCAEASWRDSRAIHNTAMVKARSAARAAARAGCRCARCNEPIMAQRSTGKFCSVRCRVAEHRERKSEEE